MTPPPFTSSLPNARRTSANSSNPHFLEQQARAAPVHQQCLSCNYQSLMKINRHMLPTPTQHLKVLAQGWLNQTTVQRCPGTEIKEWRPLQKVMRLSRANSLGIWSPGYRAREAVQDGESETVCTFLGLKGWEPLPDNPWKYCKRISHHGNFSNQLSKNHRPCNWGLLFRSCWVANLQETEDKWNEILNVYEAFLFLGSSLSLEKWPTNMCSKHWETIGLSHAAFCDRSWLGV